MFKQNLSIFNFKIIKENIFFYAKLVLIFIIAFIYFFFQISPQYTFDYTGALQDKMKRIESIDEPKIILIGNSNLAFGMKSELLECAYQMPVVNMGLHGGLGSEFCERSVIDNIKQGDIVVIANTYFSDVNGDLFEAPLAWVTLENHWDLYKLLPKNEYWNFMEGFPTYLKKCINLWIQDSGNQDVAALGCYRRNAFNEYGDIELNRMGYSYELADKTYYDLGISDERIESINRLNHLVIDAGGTLVVAGFPIAQTEQAPGKQEYLEFQKQLEEKLECKIISNFPDYLYEEKYFYDTIYHLNDEGAIIRTLQLIDDLEAWSDKNGNILKRNEIPSVYCFQNKGFYEEENDGFHNFRWGQNGSDIILWNTLDTSAIVMMEADVAGISEGTVKMMIDDNLVAEFLIDQTWKHIEIEFKVESGENDIIILCDAVNTTEDIRKLSFEIRDLQVKSR